MQQTEESSSFKIMETELGILAPAGHFYFINRKQIEEYTPGLLAKVSLTQLLKASQAWLHSNTAISLLIYALCIFFELDPLLSVPISLVGYSIWYFKKTIFIHPSLIWLARILSSNIVIYASAGVFFSYLGMNEYYISLASGVGLFFFVKPPLFKYVLATIQAKRAGGKFISEEDRVLNAILIRYAFAEGIMTSKVQEMEDRLFELIHYNRNRRK